MKVNAFLSKALPLLLLAGLPVASQAQDILKIGHVGPVSGAQAHYGKDNENGARMAVEDLNAKGVTIGGKRYKVELVAEDDAADPKQGTAAAQKLCDAKVAGVVGHLNSGTTIPAATVYNQCGIPHITPSATNPKVTQQGYQTSFALLPNDSAGGAALAAFAADSLKLKRVAVIDNDQWSRHSANGFRTTAPSKGMTVTVDRTLDRSFTDARSLVSRLRSERVEAILLEGGAGELMSFREALDSNQTLMTSFCPGHWSSDRALFCAEGGAPIDRMPGGKAWKDRYDRKYPGQFQAYSPYTYDAVHVLIDAMIRANSADPKAYIAKLKDSDYQGVTGRIQFSANGEPKSGYTTIYQYRGGRRDPGIVMISTAPGTTCPDKQCYCKSDKKCKDKCDGCG